MAHFQRNTSKGVFLSSFVNNTILALNLAAALQIPPFIRVQVKGSFLAA